MDYLFLSLYLSLANRRYREPLSKIFKLVVVGDDICLFNSAGFENVPKICSLHQIFERSFPQRPFKRTHMNTTSRPTSRISVLTAPLLAIHCNSYQLDYTTGRKVSIYH